MWKGEYHQGCNNYRSITLLIVLGKLLAHLLLMQIHYGFPLGKLTHRERILALPLLAERRREFQQEMLPAHLSLSQDGV